MRCMLLCGSALLLTTCASSDVEKAHNFPSIRPVHSMAYT